MTSKLKPTSERLSVVDSLRGFTLLAIVLLHNLEHYNIIYFPAHEVEWLNMLDKGVWETLFFLFAGKAYATFSLLFGFSFYIQLRNAQRRGENFRGRFAWRMFLLFLFAQFHALFYNGDILLLYSVVGLVLVAVCNLKDRTILIIATISLLQPLELIRITYAFINPEFTSYGNFFMKYYHLATPAMTGDSFIELLKSNIWHGQLYSNLWQVENGRLFQTAALFMFGMLLGRKEYFIKSKTSLIFWKKVLKWAALAFLPLYLLKVYVPEFAETASMKAPLKILFPSLANFAFMAILVSGFVLLWFKSEGYKFQKIAISYGRMSLTNYITQSIIGVTIYYGFGLALYKITGATSCLVIGFAIFIVQLIFSQWWLSKHKQGPFEYIWKKGTWIGAKRS